MSNSPPPFRVVVVDDEPLACSGVRQLLAADPEIRVVAECGSGREAVKAITELRPDVVFLDIQMPEMDGFDVIGAVGPEAMPPVVFLTAYDQFALRAFEVHALDYILKPFDDRRFAQAVARAKRAVTQATTGDLARRLADMLVARAGNTPYLTRIVVKGAGRTSLIKTDEVDWIEAADYCVRLHTAGRIHVLREKLSTLEERLDPERFFRIHRSAIVNLDRIRELQPYFHGEQVVILKDGTKLKLSRTRREALERVLGQDL